MQKTNVLFNSLGQKLSQLQPVPAFTEAQHYKISKGENFKLMPYMVLDYPQIKEQNVKLVKRTLFWWGHFFCCQLIIQTDLIDIEATAANLAGKRKTRLWIGSDLWDHNCKSEAFTKLKHLSPLQVQSFMEQRGHLKLASAHPLNSFNTFEMIAVKQYEHWMELIVWK